MHEAAAGIERVGEAAVERAHAQAVEHDLDPLADTARDGAAQRERALHVARAIGVACRIIEERVPPAAAFACLAAIERTRAAHDRLAAVRADGRDERLRRDRARTWLATTCFVSSGHDTVTELSSRTTVIGPGCTRVISSGTETAGLALAA